MIDKLKCPFCGAELLPHNEIENTEPIGARCGKPGCPWFMWNFPWEIWQALISGKKAQDALARAISWLETISIAEMGCATSNTASKEALDEITAITKGESNE